ncbi:SdpI family protein [Pontimicrobium sp. MEBiC01747]
MNWTDNTFLFITIITGLPFVIAALITMKFPPKKINYIYGYRTKASMKSQERWDFAQKYSSKQLLFCGLFLIAIGLLSILIPVEKSTGIYSAIILTTLCLIILLYNTETQLKKRFK